MQLVTHDSSRPEGHMNLAVQDPVFFRVKLSGFQDADRLDDSAETFQTTPYRWADLLRDALIDTVICCLVSACLQLLRVSLPMSRAALIDSSCLMMRVTCRW